MENHSFMHRFRTFFGLRPEPPRNEFRNPIWGSDDDDDGDELYSRNDMDANDHIELQREFTQQMQDMLKTFGNLFGDVSSFFHDTEEVFTNLVDIPSEPSNTDSNNIRNYYLKPGYHNRKIQQPKEDVDLDGKITSNEISGLLNQKDDGNNNMSPVVPFSGNLVPGSSFCRTIITTSVMKPDGSVETKKIVKNGKEVIEETVTSTAPDCRGTNPNLDQVSSTAIIYNNVLSSIFRNFY